MIFTGPCGCTVLFYNCYRHTRSGLYIYLIEKGRSDTGSGMFYPGLVSFFVYGDAVRNSDSKCLCEDGTDSGAVAKVSGGCVGPAAGKQT